jgi:hypothetical protein
MPREQYRHLADVAALSEDVRSWGSKQTPELQAQNLDDKLRRHSKLAVFFN